MDTTTTTSPQIAFRRVLHAIDEAHRLARQLPYGDPLRTGLADLQLLAHNERRRRE